LSGIPFLLIGYTGLKDNLLYRNQYFSVKRTFPHTNFKIRTGGESIFLTDGDNTIVDRIPNTVLPTDFSYGRIPGQDEFAIVVIP